MKKIIDIITKEIESNSICKKEDILEIYETGSKLYKEDYYDLDYIIIYEKGSEENKRIKVYDEGKVYDLLFRTKSSLLNNIKLYFEKDSEKMHIFFNFFYSIRKTIYLKEGYISPSFEVIGNQDYLNFVKEYFLYTINKSKQKYRFGKLFAYYYIIDYIIKNNTYVFSEKALIDIRNLYEHLEDYEDIIDYLVTIFS